MKPRALIVLGVAGAAIAVGALWLWLRPAHPLAGRQGELAAEPVAALATAVAEVREVAETRVAEGVVEAVRQASVAAQIAGRILELRVEAGERVRRGQLIARIDEREAAQVVASNEAQIARAAADSANALANLERTRRLFEQKFVSAAALDKAQADFDAARAQLAAARAGTGQAQAARGYATITAPFDGIVAERHVAAGDLAQPGKPIVTIFDPAAMRVVAGVPQGQVAAIRPGAGASAELPAIGVTLAARAVTVLPAADSRTQTQPVRLDLGEVPAGVTPGMFARAHFPVGRATRLVIPARAVVRRSEVTAVYVVAAGRVQFRQVRLGLPAGADGVEVLAGVAAGERVAIDQPQALAALRAGRP